MKLTEPDMFIEMLANLDQLWDFQHTTIHFKHDGVDSIECTEQDEWEEEFQDKVTQMVIAARQLKVKKEREMKHKL